MKLIAALFVGCLSGLSFVSGAWAAETSGTVPGLTPVEPVAPAEGSKPVSITPDPLARMWFVPPDFRRGPEAAAPSGQPLGDIRAYLEAVIEGLKFAPGELAEIDRSLRIVMVRANAPNLKLIEAYARDAWSETDPTNSQNGVRVEACLVEFLAAKAPEPVLSRENEYENLRQAAGDSWQVVNRLMITTKNGQRAIGNSIAGSGAAEVAPVKAPPAPGKDPGTAGTGAKESAAAATAEPIDRPLEETLKRGETGASLEIEPLMSSNGRTVDLNFVYRYRGAPGPQRGGDEWNVITTVSLKEGVPTVVQIGSPPADADASRPAKLRALILRCDSLLPRSR